MSTKIIVSYDGTPNDDDALALGKMLAKSGATLSLAYVRHTREFDPRREELAQHDAEQRLEQGAIWLDAPDTPKHVVLSGSTWEGLELLAASESAALIVFGSDYRTPPGHAEPGNTAQHMLEGAPVAIAVAAAGLRTDKEGAISSVSVAAGNADTAAIDTAKTLANSLGASLNGGRRRRRPVRRRIARTRRPDWPQRSYPHAAELRARVGARRAARHARHALRDGVPR